MSNNPKGPFAGAQACTPVKEANLNIFDVRSIRPAPNGEYFWTVRVNRQLSDGTWLTTSAFEPARRIKVTNAGS